MIASQKPRTYWMFALALVMGSTAVAAYGQNAAPSSHLVFDDNFDGDIIINEVRVPKAGEGASCVQGRGEPVGLVGRG